MGEVVPTPRKPAEVMVVVPVWPKEAMLAKRERVNSEVEVDCCSDVLPNTVSAPLAARVPPTLSVVPMVEEPREAKLVVVAFWENSWPKVEEPE